MSEKSSILRISYFVRNLRSRQLFSALQRYCHGSVLDVGGWDFHRTARRRRIPFDSWTVLEVARERLPQDSDEKVRILVGDGCDMPFNEESFETVINVQVLEHVFDPISMVQEMCRVLKPRGHLIALIPCTSALHMAPHHYYNFTRFWIQEALNRNCMQLLEIRPLGGVWSSMASHLIYFVLKSVRIRGMSTSESRRSRLFYGFYPLMLLFAVVALPICMVFSLGDLTEEPNNHLIVARKTAVQDRTDI
jgi:SAM-dependent methyltransferase